MPNLKSEEPIPAATAFQTGFRGRPMVITTFDIGRWSFTSMELTVPAGAVVQTTSRRQPLGIRHCGSHVLALPNGYDLRNVRQAILRKRIIALRAC